MLKIDAHQHFWRFNAQRDSWITDDMQVIRQDFLPDNLLPLLEGNNIDGCVAVQSVQDENDTLFLLELAGRYPFIKGIVGWVDLQAPDIGERLQHFKQFPQIKGFRHVLQGEADDQFMLRPAFKRGISLLRQYDLTYDILVYPRHLKYAEQLVAQFPDQKFVLDHLGKPAIRDQQIGEWKEDICRLATHPNVFCKVSGLVTEADWQSRRQQDFEPYLNIVLDAFGIGRVMYGSDWPVCLLAGDYQRTIDIAAEFTAHLPANDRELFWGGNAINFYNLSV